MAVPLKALDKGLDAFVKSKEKVLSEFDKLLQKGSSKDADELQKLLKKPGLKPKPEPKKEPKIINGVNVNESSDVTGDDKRVLTFGAAMEAVRVILEGWPGVPDGEKFAPITGSKTGPTLLGQLIAGGIEMVGGPSTDRQLRDIHAQMEKRLLTQKNRKKIFEKRGQTRRWP